MTQNNQCGKCKYFLVDDIKTYICTYHNCNVHGYGDKACNAFEVSVIIITDERD